MHKAELLDAINCERASLDALISSLRPTQLVGASDGGWRVSDHLSHVAAWERMIVAHLRDGSDAAVAGMNASSFAAATLDELNDHLYRCTHDRGVADTLHEFADAHRAIIAFITEMPEGRLADAYWDDDPSARTVRNKIAGDTYLHYREHAGWISELVGRATVAR